MDERLHMLWKSGAYPFDQALFDPVDIIPVDQLLHCLQDIVAFLKEQFKHDILYLNHDWHEHDGYISGSNTIKWDTYEVNLKDTTSLYDSRDGDFQVRFTVYPESLEYILRYHVYDEDDDPQYPGIWGDFELVIDKKFADRVAALLKKNGAPYCVITPKEYFDMYGGGEPGLWWDRFEYARLAKSELRIRDRTITLRQAQPGEVEAALGMALDVFMEYNAPLLSPGGISNFVDGCIQNEGYVNNYKGLRHIMFVALDGVKIIGMICERGNGSISMLYVHKAYQRQGIATALMNTMMDFFKKTDIPRATLFAAPYAVQFYHTYGFTNTGPKQNNDGFIFTPMSYEIVRQ